MISPRLKLEYIDRAAVVWGLPVASAQLGEAGGYFGWILKYGKRFGSNFDYYLMVL